jgi:hypothetical protein
VSDPLVLGSMFLMSILWWWWAGSRLAVGVGPGGQQQARQVACPARPLKRVVDGEEERGRDTEAM